MKPEVNINFTQFQPSSVRPKLPQARFLLITTSNISVKLLSLLTRKVDFCFANVFSSKMFGSHHQLITVDFAVQCAWLFTHIS